MSCLAIRNLIISIRIQFFNKFESYHFIPVSSFAKEVGSFEIRWTVVSSHKYLDSITNLWGTRWRIWLRHCATSRKVAGSIPDGVIGIFPLNLSFLSQFGPGVDSASNTNEYQEYFLGDKSGRCVGLTTLPPSSADCLEIWEPQPPGTLGACPGL
jgi:hypothetical protein